MCWAIQWFSPYLFLIALQREMQMQDNHLARPVDSLTGGRSQADGEQVCHPSQEMLDDATYELEECEEDSDLLCWHSPWKPPSLCPTPLKHLGLTKMNLNSRRFSLCWEAPSRKLNAQLLLTLEAKDLFHFSVKIGPITKKTSFSFLPNPWALLYFVLIWPQVVISWKYSNQQYRYNY